MKICSSISEIRSYLSQLRREGKSIGFVPTMGALHEGHLALVKRAKSENDIAVASIFVNPTQFNNSEDLKKYPRTLEADCELLETVDCDFVFAPTAQDMYPTLPKLKFDFGSLETVMEGEFRPGHFNGVGIVVAKLFNCVHPTRAYFGMKDIQQVAVIHRMGNDLSFDLELVPCPTIRELDGLAMSSRNRRLSPRGRVLAPQVFQSLQIAKSILEKGENAETAKKAVENHFLSFPEFKLEYLEISDFATLEPIETRNEVGQSLICIAIFLDEVRLIDNIVF